MPCTRPGAADWAAGAVLPQADSAAGAAPAYITCTQDLPVHVASLLLPVPCWRRGDVMGRFHTALYLGDVRERVRILEDAGAGLGAVCGAFGAAGWACGAACLG